MYDFEQKLFRSVFVLKISKPIYEFNPEFGIKIDYL